MEWTQAIDGYCERIDASYWAEPVNALSNLAFLVAALVMWHRCADLVVGRALAGVLFSIGLGSFLFHTHATPWAAILDVLPIMVFTLVYIFLANRDFLGWSVLVSVFGALLYLPYAFVLTNVFEVLPFFGISAFYWPLPVLIVVYGFILHPRFPATAGYLWLNAGLLSLSLVARSLDDMACAAFPVGTHFLWHLMNAIMLGAMIETWRRHRLAAG